MTPATERERLLQLQLADAQATINALLTGQVDAVVDPATKTPVLLVKAQEALHASEQRYRRIVETTSEGVWLTDATNATTFMNPRLAQILGCEADIGEQRTPFDFLQPGEREALSTHLGRTDSSQIVVRFTRADGSHVWTLLDSAPLLDAAGQYDGSLTMVMDITERRRAEEALQRTAAEADARDQLAAAALRHEHDRAQHYLNTASVILLALDLDGRVTLVNRYACSVVGWTAEELLGRDWIATCMPAALREPLRKRLLEVQAGDLSIVEAPIFTRSGDERLIEWHNTLQYDDNGTLTGTFSSGIDITAQRAASAALKTAEERTRFALTSTNIGIWDQDYTTGSLKWSETLEMQHGLVPGTFDGSFEAFTATIHPDDRDLTLRTLNKAMQEGGDFTVQYRTLWPSGTVRWLSGTGTIVHDELGQPLRAVGISQDVTERHLLEGQYLQSQRMEAVGRLAGGVAHDFNNLLSVILTCGEFLLEDLKPMDPARADADEIVKAGRRATVLTQQLLMFSRQQVLAPRVLDLGTVAVGMKGMLGRVVGEDTEIRYLNAPVLGRVRADPGSIEQVLMNLVVNARDAMPQGGQLTIETRNEFVDEALAHQLVGVTPGEHVVLAVSDTGAGMDRLTEARIFEPFFTTKETGHGTGLGLSTVFGIVQQSHGAIRVESVVGTGTTFTIYLPRDEGSADAERIKLPPLAIRGTGTVLLVEDEVQVRSVARAVLQRHGYRVVEMRSPADALLYCQSNPEPIDILLTDVVMPMMSGPELARRIVEILPTVKVLWMSGYTDDAIIRHGVLEGETAFLQKPFTPESLTAKVHEVLSHPADAAGV